MNSVLLSDSDNCITVLQQNIRSLRKNFDSFVSELHLLNFMPDIIILTEIWIEDDEVNFYILPHYSNFVKCNSEYRSGGVAIFVSDKITASQIDNTRMQTADCVRLKLMLPKNNQLELLAIYRLHEFSADNFIIELDSILTQIKTPNLMINGDININILESSRTVDEYMIKMASYGLRSLVNEPTRVTKFSKTCIDHIFYRNKLSNSFMCETQVVKTCITDHWMTVVYIRFNNAIDPSRKTYVNKQFCKLDIVYLKNIVDKICWNDVFATKIPSIALDIFVMQLQYCINKSFKTVRVKSKFIKPWMNTNIKKNIELKNQLYRNLLKSPHDPVLERTYKHYKNVLLNEIRLAKKQYYSDLFESNKNNSKTQWKLIKELTGEKLKNTSPIVLKSNDNRVISTPNEVANVLNDFFCTVADDLREGIILDSSSIDKEFDAYKNIFTSNSVNESIFFYPTCKEEIMLIIKSLRNNKAPGYDNITPIIIKEIAESIVNVLVHIFNLSMSSGIFPEKLKKAVVIPLFKKNDKTNPSNYRPIALLSIFSKILEKIVKVRLVNFLNKHNFFSNNQYGFRSRLNTSSALIDFMSQVYTTINNGKISAGIFVDVMKAFDTVDHEILLTSMNQVGIRGIPLEWFRSYLSGRSQITKVNNAVSDLGEIKLGIPQGSVLSGPLFLIYINNLCNGNFKGNLVAFADDTALFYQAESLIDLKEQMQHDVNALRWWFTRNLMVMSPKTKYIIFNLTKQTSFISALKYHEIKCSINSGNCNCQALEQVDSIKYLGLWVDSRLCWKEHLSYLKTKLVKYVRIFYMLRPVCYTQLLRSIYFSFINSKIEYGIEIWGGAYFTTLKPIVTLQKAFIRIILNKIKTEHSSPLFQSLNILPIRNLYIFKVLKIFFNRCGTNRGNQKYITLRRKWNVYVPKPKLTVFKKFFLYLAPHFYNLLPEYIKECSNKNKFIKLTRDYLIKEIDIDRFFTTLV